jgi:hypothetical protein
VSYTSSSCFITSAEAVTEVGLVYATAQALPGRATPSTLYPRARASARARPLPKEVRSSAIVHACDAASKCSNSDNIDMSMSMFCAVVFEGPYDVNTCVCIEDDGGVCSKWGKLSCTSCTSDGANCPTAAGAAETKSSGAQARAAGHVAVAGAAMLTLLA